DTNAAASCLLDAPDHAAVGDIGVDDVQGVVRILQQARDGVCDGALATRRVVEDERRNGVRPRVEVREERLDVVPRDRAAEPPEAGEEHELELRDYRAGHPQEEIVEAAVLEVVLDAGSTDPPDSAVDDYELAVIDMAEAAEVPAGRAVVAERTDRCPRLRR